MTTEHKYPDMIELFNRMFERKQNLTEHQKQVSAEVIRQLVHGLPPSEGLPDVRPNYPRYEQYCYGNGDGSGLELEPIPIDTKEHQ